jgi:2,3,4,5-tetrahydropyridine-2-carboxylate N-succinyltransferase
MASAHSLGLGIGTRNELGQWLEVFYPAPLLAPGEAITRVVTDVLGFAGGNVHYELSDEALRYLAEGFATIGEEVLAQLARSLAASARHPVLTVIAEDAKPQTVPEVYLKLHLLSHRLVKPHGLVLDGMFGVLPNVAWTSEGAVDLRELPARQLAARVAGRALSVDCVDKFPKMTDYVVPAGVRIADTARVRLGAYLGEGTTIMHEGFVNFNAGTDGPNMVEGRISAGVFVGSGSDLGGGCSTMGTLSGGGNIIISVGKECLIGANAGIGIPLGDRCTVEAGLYVTAGTKVLILDDKRLPVGEIAARELAGKSDLLFRRNSITGAVECLTNRSAVALNEALHANN